VFAWWKSSQHACEGSRDLALAHQAGFSFSANDAPFGTPPAEEGKALRLDRSREMQFFLESSEDVGRVLLRLDGRKSTTALS
jgi:hypothetical protein